MEKRSTSKELKNRFQEAVVARLKLLRALRSPCLSLRFIAISATVTNIHDIADWLGGGFREFGSDYRPVPLIPHVLSYYKGNMNGFVVRKRRMI